MSRLWSLMLLLILPGLVACGGADEGAVREPDRPADAHHPLHRHLESELERIERPLPPSFTLGGGPGRIGLGEGDAGTKATSGAAAGDGESGR